MRGAANTGGYYFRRGGKDIRIPSIIATNLCLLPVAGVVDGVVIVRQLLISTRMMKTPLLL
ncbi:hypothetical protein NC651_032857 [Populus alba x Populus x berolinensis]|nr:hypothetical protein NC651_032857 [Populus alba x Populus x berolinensis]